MLAVRDARSILQGRSGQTAPQAAAPCANRVRHKSAMRNHVAIRLLLGLSLVAAAAQQGTMAQNWPMFGGDVQSTSANPQPAGITAANVRQLRHRQVQLDGLVDASAIYLHEAAIRGASHDAIFVTTSYGKTMALDADSGDVLWEYTPASYRDLAGTRQFTNSTPVADPDAKSIYAASPDGYIEKLAIGDGRLLWRTAITELPLREKMA
ncbi:MAG TPA: PQQ-binding-like beta-propeller repeat protein, partial [Steroidobacteraceae bacterium]|nr:PQQ-binding-like beta-propeller repeat protein [Steroidobacteraceae bacterium]